MSSAMGQSSFKYATMKDWNDILKDVREVLFLVSKITFFSIS